MPCRVVERVAVASIPLTSATGVAMIRDAVEGVPTVRRRGGRQRERERHGVTIAKRSTTR